MQNKLYSFLRQQNMVQSGDTVICAVSGGADSVALLFAFYLLKDKLQIRLEAAHFNHHLRGAESDSDEAFVKDLCQRYDVPLHLGGGQVTAGEKGLEAAARDARYSFLQGLNGKIATAHTADDNAETVLMHLIRGTGLKGLGGITPIRGNIIRPMLKCTRQDVESFLEEWCLSHIEDSSNESDAFLRNRIRHHVMPLLKQENPKLAENLTDMALRLREDEILLSQQAKFETLPTVESLKTMPSSLRSRALEQFLKKNGIKEPEDCHIALTEALVFSDKPSVRASLPGGITVSRCYDRLEVIRGAQKMDSAVLSCPGTVEWADYRITCAPAEDVVNETDVFTVIPRGTVTVRSRQAGDVIRLPGGTKSVKKLFIDRKIPAAHRSSIPVICDETGILGIASIGVNQDRKAAELPAFTLRIEKIKR